MKLLQNRFATHFRLTPLFSMRTVSLASSQSCCSVDSHVPDTYFEYPAEEDGDCGDELADIDDEFLLQHGLRDVMREALTVQDVLDFLRRQRLVDHLLLLTEYSYRHL